MPLFINEEDLFEICLYFKDSDNKINVISEEDADEFTKKVICYASHRDFDTYAHILEESAVIRDTDNKTVLRSRIYYPMIISTYIKKWNLVNPNTNQFYSLEYDKIKKMDYDFIVALAKEWIKKIK